MSGATITFIYESNTAYTYNAITELDGSYEIIGIETIVGENEYSEPQAFELYQNYPNPFNPSTVKGLSLSA